LEGKVCKRVSSCSFKREEHWPGMLARKEEAKAKAKAVCCLLDCI